MAISVVVVGGVLLVAVVVALVMGGSRALPWLLAFLGLGVVAAAAVFLLRAPAPTVGPAQGPSAVEDVDGAGEEAPLPDDLAVPSETAGDRVLTGVVLRDDENRAPVAGAAVEAFGPRAGWVPFAEPITGALTDADGRFTLKNLPDGSSLRVRGSSAGLAPRTITIDEDRTDPLEILLGTAARVSGTVVEAGTRIPLEDVSIVADDAAGQRTDASGAFALEDVSAEGTSLLVSKSGYVILNHRVEFDEGDVSGLELELEPAVTLAGVVRDADGEPVAGAEVSVEFGFGAGLAARVSTMSLQRETDASGRFLFDTLTAGRSYRVWAVHGEGRSAALDVGVLERGQSRDGIELRLEPGAFLAVLVTDPEGKPVEGASVSHEATDEPSGSGSSASSMFDMISAARGGGTTTDAEGRVRLGPVEPGTGRVTARLQDYRTARAGVTPLKGESVDVAITLEPGATITGTVVDDMGQPVAGAEVTAQRFGAGSFVREQRTSAEDGTFRIGGLDGKGFNLSASHEDFVETSLNAVDPEGGPVTLTLQRGGALVGNVIDPDGAIVTAFRVSTKRTDEEETPNPMNFARMAADFRGTDFEDPEGQFRIDGLTPGVYEVTVNADGFAPGRVADLAVVATEDTTVTVQVPQGLTLRGMVVKAGDGSPIAKARVKVAGEGMFGQMDMEVDLGEDEDSDIARGTRDAMEMFGGGKGVDSGEDGRFEIRGLEPGNINLQVRASGFAPGSARSVKIPATGDLRVELAPEASLEGTVYAEDGSPKNGAMVMVQRPPTFMRMARTKEDGTYRVRGLGAGNYLFYVMENPQGGMQGMNFKSESVRLEAGEKARKDYHFGSGIRVTGTVTRGGEPVTGVMVMLVPGGSDQGGMAAAMSGSGGGFAMGATDDKGVYSITGVNPGRYTLTVQSGFGGAGGGQAVDVTEGSTVIRRDVQMPLNRIQGTVVDDGGKPVVGAMVSAVRAGVDVTHAANLGEVMDGMGGTAMTDDSGGFLIDDMAAGSFTVRVQAQGYGTAIQENVTSAETPAALRIVLEKGLEVRVRVVGADGQPVSGAGIYLSDAEGTELSNMAMFDTVRTDAKGTAVVQAPSGTINIEALANGYAPGRTTVQVPATGEVEIRLARGAVLQVKVVDGSGAALAGAVVQLLDESGMPLRRRLAMENMEDLFSGATSGSDGTFHRSDLAAGRYTVRATLEGRTGDATVTLVNGETTKVTVSVP